MPAAAKLLSDEPIMIVTLWGNISVDDTRSTIVNMARMLQHVRGPVYRIHDTRAMMNIPETNWLARMLAVSSGDDTLPMVNLLVGSPCLALMIEELVRPVEHKGLIFDALDSAVMYARRALAEIGNHPTPALNPYQLNLHRGLK